MFGALYFFWIRSQINNDEMWKDLSKKVASLVNWKANLYQWRVRIYMLLFIAIFLSEIDSNQFFFSSIPIPLYGYNRKKYFN